MKLTWGDTKVRIVRGDITEQTTEAVVNAANSSLMGGGGVDGAIHRKGGPQILAECKKVRELEWPNGLPAGKAVITSGGRLKAKHVIHTVGPIWSGGTQDERGVLAQCYMNSLALALSHGVGSVAFPSVSTGAYGFPIAEASKIALSSVREFVKEKGGPREVVFVLFSEQDLKTYERAAQEL